MQTEIEAKFLAIDHDAMRARLRDLGAECVHPMRLMTRSIMDFPDRRLEVERGGWLRIRDEGDKITLTYKEVKEHQLGGAKEIETTVGSLEKACEVFRALGMVEFSFQESKRETWRLGDAEIVLDEWPWLDPFMEIESTSEQAVQDTAKALGLAWEDAVFGTVTTIYRKVYPAITRNKHISTLRSIRFSDPKPRWFTEEDAA